jgi:hypothetical protein
LLIFSTYNFKSPSATSLFWFSCSNDSFNFANSSGSVSTIIFSLISFIDLLILSIMSLCSDSLALIKLSLSSLRDFIFLSIGPNTVSNLSFSYSSLFLVYASIRF